MISVIICSTSQEYLNQVQNSIRTTIGVEHEILFYDNSRDNKGICEVYNLLAVQAKYDYLCFVHEDVIFNTHNWGLVIKKLFTDENAGLIGVAGSKYKSWYFSGWYTGNLKFDCEYIIHQDRITEKNEKVYLNNDPQKMLQEVVSIDGVFICAQKAVWEKTKFNETDLKGFHFYDIDFSTRASAFSKIVVTYEIEMIHITHGGDFGDKWVVEAIKWHRQNKDKLPVSINILNYAGIDKTVIKWWLDWLKIHQVSFSNRLRWVYLQKLYLFPGLYYSIIKFFIYKPFRLKYLHRLVKSR